MLLWTGLHSDPNGFHFRRVKCCLELHALERQRCSVLWDAAKQKLDATSEALKVLEKSLQAAHGNPDENFEKYLTSEERGRHDKSKALASTAYSDLKEATAAKDETVDIAALFWDFAVRALVCIAPLPSPQHDPIPTSEFHHGCPFPVTSSEGRARQLSNKGGDRDICGRAERHAGALCQCTRSGAPALIDAPCSP
eukprot:2198757-Prymnesium_polylepis.2